MEPREYWVDGYNVLLFRRSKGEADLPRAREQLIRGVVAMGWRCWLVFDSGEEVGQPRVQRPSKRVRVEFTAPAMTADDVILERVLSARRLGGVTVVTNDRELAGRCRLHGATVTSVEEFLRPMRPPRRTDHERTGRPLSAAEVAEWLRYFGVDSGEPGRLDS